MSWKNWPSWLKGGVIGVIIVLVLLLVFYLFNSTACKGYNQSLCFIQRGLFVPLAIVSMPLIFIYYNSRTDNSSLMICVTIIWDILIFFLIGAVIGFIIGKIKSSKNKK